MKQGKCTKCGKFGNVVMHHAHGYEGENTYNVQPYCKSCHALIHIESRKSGKCKIHPIEIHTLSKKSYLRRNRRMINMGSTTILPNVLLSENVEYNIDTGKICCSTFFNPNHGKKLYYIDCQECNTAIAMSD